MFATHGVQVLGVDINDHIITSLSNGQTHIYEPGLQELVQQALITGNLRVDRQPGVADAFLIAVPTPFYADKTADMRAVTSATEAIVPYLRPGNLVVLESTSPPRTTLDLVLPILERTGLKAGQDFYLAYSPERVLPGKILEELVHNARVIGGLSPECARKGRDLYAHFVEGEIIETDATTAEMVKLMENTYRDVNIAIANEFSRLADRFGVDVWEAISLANRHPRVRILNPGPGVGGHCISVDPWFLVQAAPDLTPLIHTARTVNDGQPHFVVSLVKRLLGSLDSRRITALGLAFKPDVDDLRESPAVEVCQLLSQAGACVQAYEPYQPEMKFGGFETHSSLEDALKDAELILLLVGHSGFRSLDPEQMALITPARLVLDTVNAFSRENWSKAGFSMSSLGAFEREKAPGQ
jgi:UDP-N-acetyl-D-mannosaminuronic acid dehydrogenase